MVVTPWASSQLSKPSMCSALRCSGPPTLGAVSLRNAKKRLNPLTCWMTVVRTNDGAISLSAAPNASANRRGRSSTRSIRAEPPCAVSTVKRNPVTASDCCADLAAAGVNVTRWPRRGRASRACLPAPLPVLMPPPSRRPARCRTVTRRRRHRPCPDSQPDGRGRCRWWRGSHDRAGAALAAGDRRATGDKRHRTDHRFACAAQSPNRWRISSASMCTAKLCRS